MTQKTLETLTGLLKKDERLVVESNLAKNKIIELALQLDLRLLKLLKSSPEIKKIFFQEVDDILVFDKIKFQSFISNKQFLPDSFTAYKNKIGLSSDRQYLTDSGEVVLYDKGEKVSMDNISPNDNLIIKGNNLLSLYSLKEKYQNKIKLIYIDPPYNPDSKSNTFVYNNGFNESTWLTFMKNRLEVAKKLLTSDGCLIVAIDKNEQAELTVLLKELFRGYEIHVITIVHNLQGTQAVGFSYVHEYAIFVIPSSKLINKRKIDAEWRDFMRWDSGIVGNDKNAIILDFFGGSGTTAHAVLELNKQDDGNRKFIVCEQMDYIETVTKERIRKVCENDNKGSFVYCELAEFNQQFINQIQEAKNIEPKDIDDTKKEFEELLFEDQQKFLISLLDKNLLYVSYCDMEDKSYVIPEEVKKLNRQFYEEG
ncbi:15720_t:CDS:2 [Entrophospora sp. SA101]|nr:15720_t:CDS:2 [Entrophospora sp. SA101]CAJ0913741.1 12894_t:CDS:2 [Entrophospora sp. SA101]